MARVLALLSTCLIALACGPAEDPARAELRERLKQESPLSNEDLARVRDEVGKAMAGKTFLKEGAATPELDAAEREVVFGMLTDPAGMFDEGLRTKSGTTFRVLNAPGLSGNAEIEASRRLLVDVETFLPARFEFFYAFPGYGDYSFDLVVDQ
jgi:hypothetical protein